MAASGDGLCLVSAIFFALWVVQTGHHLERHPQPSTTTLVQCLCAALMSAPFVSLWHTRDVAVWVEALPAAVYPGLFSTAAAFGLTAVAQTRVSASATAILVAVQSLFGTGAGIVFPGERPAVLVQIGAVLILTAIVVMALRPELREPRPAAKVAGPV